MNRLFKGIYAIGIVLLLMIIFVMIGQNARTGLQLSELIESNARISVNAIGYEIETWLEAQREVLYDAQRYAFRYHDLPDKMEGYLMTLMAGDPAFATLYYGNEAGDFVNGTGFEWPNGLDYKERPWYKLAKETQQLVITQPFQNAIANEMIISVAVPVLTYDGEFVGVIAGDIPLSSLYDFLNVQGHFDHSFAYLVSDDATLILASKMGRDADQTYEALQKWVEDKRDSHSGNAVTTLHGVKGLCYHQKIGDTSWRLLSFTSLEVYSNADKVVSRASYVLLGFTVFVFMVLFYLQSRYVTKPILALEAQIEAIDVEANVSHRIQNKHGKAFQPLINKINDLLTRIDNMVRQLQDDRDEFQTMTEEIEASYHQVIAAEQEMSRQKLCFEALFRHTEDAIVMFDQNHRILDINARFTALFGYELLDIRGKDLDDVISGKNVNTGAKDLTRALFQGVPVRKESVRFGKNNLAIDVAVHGVPMIMDGVMMGGYGIYTDISDRKKKEAYLAYMGTHDDLTDLYNRSYMNRLLAELNTQEHLPLGIIMLDVNGLKLINDAFGQNAGDKLLIEIAHYLRMLCKEEHIIGRMGGDEFVVICPMTNEAEIEALSKRIKKACKEVSVGSGDVSISVSVGWAEKKSLDQKMSDILKTAEDYMNRRKLSEGPSVRGKAIYAMIKTLHEKNKREEQHSIRVSELSERLGKRLKLSERDVHELKTMGLLHDIGKIGIDERILNKTTHLTPEEFEEIKKHPEIGYRILSSVNEMSEMAEHVLAHHERWDGLGYPKGLKGEDIPYLARIISIVDAFDAMTSDRSYRKGMSQEEAFAELRRFSGLQFDPALVDIFIEEMV